MSSDLPQVFRLSVTPYFGRSFSLILREGNLLYNSTRPKIQSSRNPTEADWQKFWKKTVRSKIWLWESQYIDISKSDGSCWSVNIEVGNLSLKSFGSNTKPENFEEFLQAVRDLVPGLELVLS